MQQGLIMLNSIAVNIELPSQDDEIQPGLQWGAIDAFPTPAYWLYQVLAHRVAGKTLNYKLGNTLTEEVGACLLGGHGIPAKMGMIAYNRLRELGVFKGDRFTEDAIYNELKKPFQVNNREVHYRFSRQKSRYISSALERLNGATPPTSSGKELRSWLLKINGVGLKTASWIARNWLNADDVAILDIHILRAGNMTGFFSEGLSVEKDYLKLEEQFIQFGRSLEVKISELDAIIWLEMMSSSATVHNILKTQKLHTSPPSQQSKPNPIQTQLAI